MAVVNPYLNFDGNCEEAFEFYKSVFGGDYMGGIMRFGDTGACEGMTDADKNMVMHVSLPISDGNVLMGSDCPAAMGPVKFGNSNTISIGTDSKEETEKLFNGLSEGGKVTQALEKMFWGGWFGAWEDKFGQQWLINYQEDPPPHAG
jgi:PhnB protein